MIAYEAFNYGMKKGLFFVGSEWLLRAIEDKNPNINLALAYSVAYDLKAQCALAVEYNEYQIYLN